MCKQEITIVVTAFNRPDSLKRLLYSLSIANYLGDKVRLVISIDKGDNEQVLEIAEKFQWLNGEKIIKYAEEYLGLRRHIIRCGDLTEVYGNIILLEDDLFCSPNFYSFAKQALDYYRIKDEVAGISLYSQNFCETSDLPFIPIKEKYDVYFMQLPSSWGQLWTDYQWKKFKDWYEKNKDIDLSEKMEIPYNIRSWPESSWKKYFTYYLIETNRYFVYPYESLTTNFGDIGVHFEVQSNAFQVPLSYEKNKTYNFCSIEDTIAVYDAFCENQKIKIGNISPSELCVDIYGTKPVNIHKEYVLSTKKYKYKIVKSYGLRVYPPENNIFMDINGNDIYLYYTQGETINKGGAKEEYLLFWYYYPTLSLKKIIYIYIKEIKNTIKKLLLSFY